MEKVTYSTVINAPRQKVWDTMLGKETYEQWTAAFQEGSTYTGNWEEGTEMIFTGPTDDENHGGMYAVIAEYRPQEFVSIKHQGEIKNGEKVPWSAPLSEEGYENYTFRDVDGGTEVFVELVVPKEWISMFEGMWPKALAILKELAEK